MGMFDYYKPKPINCLACKRELDGWQGKDACCALVVWQEGSKHPVEQAVPDECKGNIANDVLPERFEFYTHCECGVWVQAVGYAPIGIWNRSELLNDSNAVPYPEENEREFRERKLKYRQGN